MLLFCSVLFLSTNALVAPNNVFAKAMLQQSETAANVTSTTVEPNNSTAQIGNSTTGPDTSNNTQVCDVCWDGSVPQIQGYYCTACPEQTFTDKCDYGRSLCEAVAGTWSDSLCSCQFGQTIPTTNTTTTNSTEETNQTTTHKKIQNFGVLSGASTLTGVLYYIFGKSQIFYDNPDEWYYYEQAWFFTTITFLSFWITNFGLWLGFRYYKSDFLLFAFETVLKYSHISEAFIYVLFVNLIVQLFRYYYSSFMGGHSQLRGWDDWSDDGWYDDNCDDYYTSDSCQTFFYQELTAAIVFLSYQVVSQINLVQLKKPMLRDIRQQRQDLKNEIPQIQSNTTNSSNELPTL